MCGILGVAAHTPVNQLLYDGLMVLQHRGQDAAGIATAEGTTALTYARDNSMRALLLDKIARSELIVFNRAEAVNNDAARQELHKLVRQASRKCDIAYEFKDGSVAYDDIPDPLPFDINAPVIDIPDDDYGIWYMDCQDEPQKYAGKTVKFLAQVCQTNRAGKNSFVPGRFGMCHQAGVDVRKRGMAIHLRLAGAEQV